MMKGLAVTVLAAGSVTIAAHAAPGPIPSPAALARVSGASPVASCWAAADSMLPPGSTEPVIAVNPRNPANLVALWQQDHMHAIVAGVSFNRGRNWRPVNIAGMTRCTGGRLHYADDPSIGFGPDGTVYASAHTYDLAGNKQTVSGHVLARSVNGGLTWSRPVPVIPDIQQEKGETANGSIAVDRRDPHVIYSVMPVFAAGGTGGTVLFTQSRDRGRHWGTARTIFATGPGQVTTGHQLLVLPNDQLVDVFTLINTRPYAKTVAVLRSTNRGRTWSPPVLVAALDSTPIIDPHTKILVGSGGTLLADAAADPVTGRIYVVWQDARFSQGKINAIALSTSGDGGRTWSPPANVNVHASTNPALNEQALIPSVAVADGGAVGVSWYQLRPHQAGPALLTDRLLAVCHPVRRGPCTAFETPAPLTATPFDFTKAPVLTATGPPGGYFVGDYMFMAAAGNAFADVFSQPAGTAKDAVFAGLAPVCPGQATPGGHVHPAASGRADGRSTGGGSALNTTVRGTTPGLRHAGGRVAASWAARANAAVHRDWLG